MLGKPPTFNYYQITNASQSEQLKQLTKQSNLLSRFKSPQKAGSERNN